MNNYLPMNMVRFLLFLILLTCFQDFLLQAQDGSIPSTSGYFESSLIGQPYLPPPTGGGSPNLDDNWVKGSVILISGDTVKNKLLRFDCFKNELVWLGGGQTVMSVDPNLITGFTLFPENRIEPRVFEKTNLKLPFFSDTSVCYLEMFYKGKINLYVYRRVSVSIEPMPGKGGGFVAYPTYMKEPVYYMQIGNLPVTRIELRKRSIINAFPEYTVRIKQILRKQYSGSIRNEIQLYNAIKLIDNNLEY